MEDIGKLLKHPLVIIVAVLLAALVFYNNASPYKRCLSKNITFAKQINPKQFEKGKPWAKYATPDLENKWERICAQRHSW
ncbi:MAG: hypothetical protein CMM53_09135 [Rhodospirillaceae bacterium]|nr:hypothetical protein [Rhodospirillaceae bacterium]|tara:strand:+ start:751 stop:990 length:240 start_codon:yes stop_codon:yes gene_type:complete